MQIGGIKMQLIIDEMTRSCLTLGKTVLGALIVLAIGLYLSKIVTKIAVNAMIKAKIEPTLVYFLKSVVSSILKIIVFLSALNTLGFPSTSLFAIFGTAGAALALGFKDSLGSFTSGVIILFSKPFKVGDYIQIEKYEGTVREIQVMYTTLTTSDNKVVMVPNSEMTSNILVNYSYQDSRRIELTFDISYEQDVETVKKIIHKVISEQPLAMLEPKPFVRVANYKSSSVEILVRVWCKKEDHVDLKFNLIEDVRKAFIKNNIEMPFNQLDINIKQTN